MGLSVQVLPKGVLSIVKRSPTAYAVGRRARFALGSMLGARRVAGIPGRCHYNDFMLGSTDRKDADGYHRGAVDFVDMLEDALRRCGRDWRSVGRCLEVGSGYGRIVRVLGQRLPPEKISVCDVIEEAARFTAAEFGAERIPVIENAGDRYADSFDLIYLLSVYTHLRREHVEDHVRRLGRALRSGGVLVFTLHGETSARSAERYGHAWLDKEQVLEELQGPGYAYRKYPYYGSDYGMTWMTQAYVRGLVQAADASLEFVSFEPAGLDGHQDVYVYRKP